MRFRKSLKVTKGVKLNLSKTGASFTLGSGLPVSLNVGTKGAFLNWSIPGTGVYDRVRLDKVLKEKLGGVFGFGKASAEEETQEKGTAKTAGKKTKTKKEPARPADAEMEAIAQEIALINIYQQAIDVNKAAEGTLEAAKAERALEDWLAESEAPIEFSIQTEVVEEKNLVMIDLDLPEIEDMPQNTLSELADGTVKIKKKTKKQQYQDYRTCVFGLGEYVASHAFAVVPQAEKIVVSAYTQRRDEKTGDQLDVFIYSVVFERGAFVKDYQEKDPYDFCGEQRSRFYVLASGVMKEIAPFEAANIE